MSCSLGHIHNPSWSTERQGLTGRRDRTETTNTYFIEGFPDKVIGYRGGFLKVLSCQKYHGKETFHGETIAAV